MYYDFFNETPNLYPAVLQLPVCQKWKLSTLQADKAYSAHTERFAFTSFWKPGVVTHKQLKWETLVDANRWRKRSSRKGFAGKRWLLCTQAHTQVCGKKSRWLQKRSEQPTRYPTLSKEIPLATKVTALPQRPSLSNCIKSSSISRTVKVISWDIGATLVVCPLEDIFKVSGTFLFIYLFLF